MSPAALQEAAFDDDRSKVYSPDWIADFALCAVAAAFGDARAAEICEMDRARRARWQSGKSR